MSFTRALLSMARPFSSKNIASSAKYFLEGSWLPGTMASSNSCVRRTNSSSVMVGSSATLRHATADVAARNKATKNLNFMTSSAHSLNHPAQSFLSQGVLYHFAAFHHKLHML